MPPDDELLLFQKDLLERLAKLDGIPATLKAIQKQLEALPCKEHWEKMKEVDNQVQDLRRWRTGIVAVGAFITLMLGALANFPAEVISWFKGGR